MDSQRPAAGAVLVAEQDGVIVAARRRQPLIADPFRPTADIVALLRLRAGPRARTPAPPLPRARAAPARRVTRAAAPAPPRRPAIPRAPSRTPLVWAALWTVYIVWGSTYLALRVLVETIPPLISTGSRFLLAGA